MVFVVKYMHMAFGGYTGMNVAVTRGNDKVKFEKAKRGKLPLVYRL